MQQSDTEICLDETVNLLGLLSHDGFTGNYAPGNWVETSGTGSITTSGAPDSIVLTSGATEGVTDFSIGVLSSTKPMIVSFDWAYTSLDDPSSDMPQYVIDSQSFNLPNYDLAGPFSQNGTASIEIAAGETFAFRAVSDYSNGGTFTVYSHFSVTPVYNNTVLNWYTVSSGGTSLGASLAGEEFEVAPSFAGTNEFYVEVKTTECTSSTREMISVEAHAKPMLASIAVTPSEICFGEDVDLTASTVINGFTSYYDTINWTISHGSGGEVNVSSAPNQISLMDGFQKDIPSVFDRGVLSTTDVTTVSFNWVYDGGVSNSLEYTIPQVVLNGVPADLTGFTRTGGRYQNGTASFDVNPNETFAFQMDVLLSNLGDGIVTISNFVSSKALNGFDISWYDQEVDGTLLGMTEENDSLTVTPTVDSDHSYYAEVISDQGCLSLNRVETNLIVNEVPAYPPVNLSASPGRLCVLGTTSDLLAPRNVNWYAISDSTQTAIGSSLFDQNFEVTPTELGTNYFMARSVSLAGCINPQGVLLTVEVSEELEAPNDVFASQDEICLGQDFVLSSTDDINWYTDSIGGTVLVSTNSSKDTTITPLYSGDLSYYAEGISTQGCISSARTEVAVLVTQQFSAENTRATLTDLCPGQTTELAADVCAVGFTGDYHFDNWVSTYDVDDIDFSKGPDSLILISTEYDYSTLKHTNPVLLENATITFDWSVTTVGAKGLYLNYAVNTDLRPFSDFGFYQFGALVQQGTASIELQAGDLFRFESYGPFDPHHSTVVISNFKVCYASSGDVNWYKQPSGGVVEGVSSPSSAFDVLTNETGVHKFYASVSGCTNSTRDSVAIDVDYKVLDPINNNVTPIEVCLGDTGDLASGIVGDGIALDWYSALTGGTSLDTSLLAATYEVTPTSTGTDNYYVQAFDANGCLSENRTLVSIVTKELPTAPANAIATSTVLCLGDSTMLDAGNIEANWFDAEVNGQSLGSTMSNESLKVIPSLAGSMTYYVESVSQIGCGVSARVPVSVMVNPLPNAPTLSASLPDTLCLGASSILKSVGDSVRWYLEAVDGSSIGSSATGNDFVVEPLLAGTHQYYAESISQDNCISEYRTVTGFYVRDLPNAPFNLMAFQTDILLGDDVDLSGELLQTQTGFDTTKWSLVTSLAGGRAEIGSAPDSIVLITGPVAETGIITYSLPMISALASAQVSFDWSLYALIPYLDRPRFVVNGVASEMTGFDAGGSSNQFGNMTITIPAGQSFGFEIDAQDGWVGLESTLLIKNFEVTMSGGLIDWYDDAALQTSIGSSGSEDPFTVTPLLMGGNDYFAETTDDFGCKSEATVVTVNANVITGVESTSEEMKIYPNPVHGAFAIEVSDLKYQWITIMSGTGKTVLKERVQGQTTVIDAEIPAGVYFVELSNGHEVVVRKVVITK
jgi:hypothetical protein